MDHVAIMKKSWDLLPKILNGEKTVESRWYLSRKAPWGKVKKGDTVYFKNSGEEVVARAKVKKVEEFEYLNPKQVRQILKENMEALGIDNYRYIYKKYRNKKFCVLVFLNGIEKIEEPFQIDKTGFGIGSAWICADCVDDIRLSN